MSEAESFKYEISYFTCNIFFLETNFCSYTNVNAFFIFFNVAN